MILLKHILNLFFICVLYVEALNRICLTFSFLHGPLQRSNHTRTEWLGQKSLNYNYTYKLRPMAKDATELLRIVFGSANIENGDLLHGAKDSGKRELHVKVYYSEFEAKKQNKTKKTSDTHGNQHHHNRSNCT